VQERLCPDIGTNIGTNSPDPKGEVCFGPGLDGVDENEIGVLATAASFVTTDDEREAPSVRRGSDETLDRR